MDESVGRHDVADTLSTAERRAIPGSVAFVSERDGDAEVYLQDPAGDCLRRLTVRAGADYPAQVHPSGDSLLVLSVDEAAGVHREWLTLYSLSGSGGRPIGPRAGRIRNPSWSTHGEWLVFESDHASFRDLYRLDSGGARLRRLTDDERGNFEPQLSPDGERIAFVSSRDGDAEIYLMRADGGKQRRLTAFHRSDTAPLWSSDGRWIAFVSDRLGMDRVFVVAPDGTGQRAVRALPASPSEPADDRRVVEGEVAWAPAGAWERLAYVARTPAAAAIWVVDIAAGMRRRVTASDGHSESPAWSPDGRHLAFVSHRGGYTQIYLMRADGSGVTPLTRSPGGDWLPRWVRRTSPAREGCAPPRH